MFPTLNNGKSLRKNVGEKPEALASLGPAPHILSSLSQPPPCPKFSPTTEAKC